MSFQSNITQDAILVGDASLGITSISGGTTGQVLSATTGGTPVWAAPPESTIVGSAVSFFLDAVIALADNFTLSTTPSTYPETINSKAVTVATSPVFFERFVSGPLGRTEIAAGAWRFHIFGAINNTSGTNVINFRVNKRVEKTGMTGTFTGAGPTRTFTVTGGTPFVPGDANASILLASLIETPTQTAWISGYTSSSEVTVTLTDPAFVNVAGVNLNAIYYLIFNDSTATLSSTSPLEYTVTSVQPLISGLDVTDRIVFALFATSSANRTMSLYYGGASNHTYFTTPLATLTTLTGNSGGVISADSDNNFDVVGTGSITTVGTTNTITAQLTGLTNHALQVGAGTATLTQLALGSAGQVLRSGGAGADPAYSTATYPATAGTAGQLLVSDGTNYSSAATSTGDFTFTTSTAGATRALSVENSDNSNTSSNAALVAKVGGTSSGDPFTRYAVGTSRSYAIGIDTSSSQILKINTDASGTAGISTGTNLQSVTSGGNRTLPLNACCTADLNTGLTNATGDGTFINPLIFDVDSGSFFDQNSNYSTSTGLFTAPVTGKYLVVANVTLNGIGAGHTSGIIRLDAAGGTYAINQYNPAASMNAANEVTVNISCIVPATAASTIAILIQVSGSTKTVGVKGNIFGSYSRLSINLIS